MGLIEVKNLRKYFTSGLFRKSCVKAVDGVSFEVEEGETFALVGESGCGKSTVGRCILRLIEPTAGEVYFRGINISGSNGNLRGLRKKMQMIFQDADGTLNPRMRVFDLITEPSRVHRLVNGREKAAELMEMVNLTPDLLGRYPHELSGGQRHRIGIARAMSLNPEFIVADELAASLDLSVQAQMLDLMKRLQAEFAIGYLFISHNLNVVKLMADRVAVMYLGKFVEVGDTRRIFSASAHPYTQALLSTVLNPNPSARRKRIVLEGEIPSPLNPPSGCRFHPRCPEAKAICSEIEADLREIEDRHLVSCHFA
ncbi:MAG: ABC transporter ATP-binding protein [Dehalococcoidia bacterium]|nr:Oligopeptide transport ATP-binding protein OppF [Chloroflexota bacterium]MBT9159842.1 Oligopeptide transport ATP-binding protein OppF [Chloroflexota bacterium]MBT9161861.1 Oligopeptide transport ATP-binding protein OppF [Chloroflexota bacterium]